MTTHKPTIDTAKPVDGLEHLRTGIRNGERWYDLEADEAMYPRYQDHERARFYPNDTYVGDEWDVVLHFKIGPLKVRALLHDHGKTITVCSFKKTRNRWTEVPEVISKADLKGIYPVKQKIMMRHHPDYSPNA